MTKEISFQPWLSPVSSTPLKSGDGTRGWGMKSRDKTGERWRNNEEIKEWKRYGWSQAGGVTLLISRRLLTSEVSDLRWAEFTNKFPQIKPWWFSDMMDLFSPTCCLLADISTSCTSTETFILVEWTRLKSACCCLSFEKHAVPSVTHPDPSVAFLWKYNSMGNRRVWPVLLCSRSSSCQDEPSNQPLRILVPIHVTAQVFSEERWESTETSSSLISSTEFHASCSCEDRHRA